MIPYSTHPVIAEFGFLKIYSYGVMMALAFLIGTYLAAKEAKRRGYNEDTIYSFSIVIILSSLFGARLLFALQNQESFLDFFKLYRGGLSYFGGLIGGLIGLAVYCKIKKISLPEYLDIFAPSIALGQAIGRVGCYLRGCCYGLKTNLPWAVYHEGALRHPTQLYSIILDLVMFGILFSLRKKKLFKGGLFVIYLIIYSIIRFIIDIFRESTRYFWGLTLAQIICIIILLIAMSIFICYKIKKSKK